MACFFFFKVAFYTSRFLSSASRKFFCQFSAQPFPSLWRLVHGRYWVRKVTPLKFLHCDSAGWTGHLQGWFLLTGLPWNLPAVPRIFMGSSTTFDGTSSEAHQLAMSLIGNHQQYICKNVTVWPNYPRSYPPFKSMKSWPYPKRSIFSHSSLLLYNIVLLGMPLPYNQNERQGKTKSIEEVTITLSEG